MRLQSPSFRWYSSSFSGFSSHWVYLFLERFNEAVRYCKTPDTHLSGGVVISGSQRGLQSHTVGVSGRAWPGLRIVITLEYHYHKFQGLLSRLCVLEKGLPLATQKLYLI